ncbi:MAG: hypothetical protein WBC92_08330 [Terracidiphilus sp.]
MSSVVCTAELHGSPSEEQLNEFQSGMGRLGLLRTINHLGKTFMLPAGVYVGGNIAAPLSVLSIRVNSVARRATGSDCKLALSSIDDLSRVYFSGLEEQANYANAPGIAPDADAAAPRPAGSYVAALLNFAAQRKRQGMPVSSMLERWSWAR